jgi:predicted transcriptional regulator
MRIDRASPWTYARWFQALADPSRAIICNLLADAGRPMTVGEMVQAIEIGQSTVSHHLKLLAEVGFVQASPKGTDASTGSTPVPGDLPDRGQARHGPPISQRGLY